MKQARKNGFGTLFVSGILFMIAMIIITVFLVTQKKPDMYAGEIALSVLKAASMAESYKTFLKTSARVSDWKAELEIMSNAGYSTKSACGSFGYQAWNNRTSKCYPDISSEFLKSFNKHFNEISANYYGIQLQDYTSGFSKTGDKNQITVSFNSPVDIPVVTKDFSVAIKASPDYEFASFIPANPNHYLPNRASDIDTIVIHYTAGSLESTISTFQDPDKTQSAHYIVDRDGNVIQMVKEKDVAYHAGCVVPQGLENEVITTCITPHRSVCSVQEFHNINSRSIGIELVNLGYECNNSKGKGDKNIVCEYKNGKQWEVYSKQQITALSKLVAYLINKYNIKPTHPTISQSTNEKNGNKTNGKSFTGIIGHEQVTPCKQDPGPLFPWDDFLKQVNYYSKQFSNQTNQTMAGMAGNEQGNNQGNSQENTQENESGETTETIFQESKCDRHLTEWHRYADSSICWRLTSTGLEYKFVDPNNDCNQNAEVYTPKTRSNCVDNVIGNKDLMRIINEKSSKYNIPPALIVATICTESAGKLEPKYLIRFEKGHYTTAFKNNCKKRLMKKGVSEDKALEYCTKEFVGPGGSLCKAAYACSFGLGHILYTTAIQLGFTQSPDTLVDKPDPITAADNSVELIARYIKLNADKTKLDPPKVAAAYNHGSLEKACPGDFSGSYRKFTNSWCLFSNPRHIDKFVSYYNDAVSKGLAQCTGFSVLASNIGTLKYTPRFSIDFNPDFAEINKLISWVDDTIKNYDTETGCELKNREYLNSKINDFNNKSKKYSLLRNITLGSCDISDEKLFIDLKTSLKLCSLSNDTNCLCPITKTYTNKQLNQHHIRGDYKFELFTNTINNSIITISSRDMHDSFVINAKIKDSSTPDRLDFTNKGFHKALKHITNGEKQIEEQINDFDTAFIYFYNNSQSFKNGLFLFKKGDKYLYFNVSNSSVSNSKGIVVKEYKPVERLCNIPEEFFNLCVGISKEVPIGIEQPHKDDDNLWKQLKLRFAIFIPDRNPPKNPKILNVSYDNNKKQVILSWESEDLNDTLGFMVYYHYKDIILSQSICPYKPDISEATAVKLYLWNSSVISQQNQQNQQNPGDKKPGILYIEINNNKNSQNTNSENNKINKMRFYYVIDIIKLLNDCLKNNACQQISDNNQLITTMNFYVLITAFDSENNENLYDINNNSKTLQLQVITPNVTQNIPMQ